jgi:hypothetical protein
MGTYKESNVDCSLCVKPGKIPTKMYVFEKKTVTRRLVVYACPQCDLMQKKSVK